MEPKCGRIPGLESDEVDAYARRIFEAQTKIWGAPLFNHQVYARRPALLKAVRAMWAGLEADRLLDPKLVCLLNRRVARLNGCAF